MRSFRWGSRWSVSTRHNMSRYVRPARRSRWGSVHGAQLIRPTCPGWLWRWMGVPVPRLFLCVGALHPIRRHYTPSVRVHRHVTGAVPLIGCSAPVLVAVVAAVGVVGVFWA